MKRKVHMQYGNVCEAEVEYGDYYTACGRLEFEEGTRYWEFVTCKRCLQSKPRKGAARGK